MAGYKSLVRRLADWAGTIGDFSRELDRDKIPYLSFSKVGCVEFCGYRYLLEYVRRQYKAVRCLAFVDQYRWVPNLDRIRKPAFQRTQVRLDRSAWPQATRRLDQTHRRIREIERNQDAWATGECYLCPYKATCPKASVGLSGYSRW